LPLRRQADSVDIRDGQVDFTMGMKQCRCGLQHYSAGERSMETITVESMPVVVGHEEDGRW
jgi:hypothetical protein